MPQLCEVSKCERVARVPCDCCEKRVCLQHLNDHNMALVLQLNPFTDEINSLNDRINSIDIQKIVNKSRTALKKWQKECHSKIDWLFEKKCRELDEFVTKQLNQQKENMYRIRFKLSKLISNQEATKYDINMLSSNVQQLAKAVRAIEHVSFRIDTKPLVVNDDFIKINKISEHQLDQANFLSVIKTVDSPYQSFVAMAINDRYLLAHLCPNLSLIDLRLNVLKEVLWLHGDIWDMCWSSKLNRFIVMGKSGIVLVDVGTMSLEQIDITVRRNWLSCSCSDTTLFLTTDTWGSSIFEFMLAPKFAFSKEWRSPITCGQNERIDKIVCNNQSCAIIIKNNSEKSVRMELRSTSTFDRIWSLQMDGRFNSTFVFGCCLLHFNEWLFLDHERKRLMHLTDDGNVKKTISYKEIPYGAGLLGIDILALSTKSGINFHKI